MSAYDDGFLALLGTDVLVYLACDDASGNLADTSGNSRNATASGTSTYAAAGPTINGVAQSAVEFSGTSYFTLASSLPGASAVNGRTYLSWVYLPGDTTVAGTILSRAATNLREMVLQHSSGGSAACMAYQSDGNTLVAQANGADLDGGTWFCMVGWWDPADQDVYLQLNGGTPVSAAGSTDIKTNSTTGVGVGATPFGSSPLRSGARMSKVAIIDRVLTADERTAIATGQFSTSTSAGHASTTLASYAAVPKVSPNAGNAPATLAAYNVTANVTTLAGHASITFESYVPMATATGSPSGAYAGHAFIDFWASEGDFSDLDSDSGGGAAVMAAYQPSVSVKATAQHASITFSALGVSEGYPGSVFAEHAAIAFSSGDLSHGAAAGHASISAAAGDIDYDLGAMAGQASPQFTVSAYNASVSSDYTYNVFAGHASITVESYQPGTSGSTLAGHASITVSGFDVTTPSVPADLLVEVYDAVTLSVDVSLYVDVTLDVEVY